MDLVFKAKKEPNSPSSVTWWKDWSRNWMDGMWICCGENVVMQKPDEVQFVSSKLKAQPVAVDAADLGIINSPTTLVDSFSVEGSVDQPIHKATVPMGIFAETSTTFHGPTMDGTPPFRPRGSSATMSSGQTRVQTPLHDYSSPLIWGTPSTKEAPRQDETGHKATMAQMTPEPSLLGTMTKNTCCKTPMAHWLYRPYASRSNCKASHLASPQLVTFLWGRDIVCLAMPGTAPWPSFLLTLIYLYMDKPHQRPQGLCQVSLGRQHFRWWWLWQSQNLMAWGQYQSCIHTFLYHHVTPCGIIGRQHTRYYTPYFVHHGWNLAFNRSLTRSKTSEETSAGCATRLSRRCRSWWQSLKHITTSWFATLPEHIQMVYSQGGRGPITQVPLFLHLLQCCKLPWDWRTYVKTWLVASPHRAPTSRTGLVSSQGRAVCTSNLSRMLSRAWIVHTSTEASTTVP